LPLVFYRETFSEEEVDGMVLSGAGQEAKADVKPAVVTENTAKPVSQDQLSADMEEDLVMVDAPENLKRKLETDEVDALPKKVKVR
jgi:hypothetical protein